MNEGMVPFVRQRRLLDVSLSPVHSVKTPLRYPGGKSVLSSYVSGLIDTSGCRDTYVEPYAGGAGIALRLLAEGKVSGIVINDMDANVHAFWDSVVNDHASFMQLFEKLKNSQSFIAVFRMGLRLLAETATAEGVGEEKTPHLSMYVKKYAAKAKKNLRNRADGQDIVTYLDTQAVTPDSMIKMLQSGAHGYTSTNNREQAIALSILLGQMLILSHGRE